MLDFLLPEHEAQLGDFVRRIAREELEELAAMKDWAKQAVAKARAEKQPGDRVGPGQYETTLGADVPLGCWLLMNGYDCPTFDHGGKCYLDMRTFRVHTIARDWQYQVKRVSRAPAEQPASPKRPEQTTQPKPDLSELRELAKQMGTMAHQSAAWPESQEAYAWCAEMLTAALDRLERPHTPPRGPEEA